MFANSTSRGRRSSGLGHQESRHCSISALITGNATGCKPDKTTGFSTGDLGDIRKTPQVDGRRRL